MLWFVLWLASSTKREDSTALFATLSSDRLSSDDGVTAGQSVEGPLPSNPLMVSWNVEGRDSKRFRVSPPPVLLDIELVLARLTPCLQGSMGYFSFWNLDPLGMQRVQLAAWLNALAFVNAQKK